MVAKNSETKKSVSSKVRTSYKKRRDGMKKKARELATLCGVQVCVVFIGPEGDVGSWPEDVHEVRSVVDKYENYKRNGRNKGGVGISAEENLLGLCDVDGLSGEALKNLLSAVDRKLIEVKQRIELVEFMNKVEAYGAEETMNSWVMGTSVCEFDSETGVY